MNYPLMFCLDPDYLEKLAREHRNDFSYHGHPELLNCPEGMTRKSLALYYYSNGQPPEELAGPHSTIFKGRPGEKLFLQKESTITVKSVVKQLIPPIFIEAYKSMTKR